MFSVDLERYATDINAIILCERIKYELARIKPEIINDDRFAWNVQNMDFIVYKQQRWK